MTAAEMLSVAAFLDGQSSQAFPSFGSERMGAPVVSFCKIDVRPIRSHDPVTDVDALVIQDASLLHEVDLFAGLESDGYVLINTGRGIEDLELADLAMRVPRSHLLTVPATEIARRLVGRPVPNTALLGGLAEVTGVVSASAVAEAIRRRFSGRLADANERAAAEAARVLRAERRALADA